MQHDDITEQDRKPAIERRLATIMMADVAGYSRMMGTNEERTVQTLRKQREIFKSILQFHRGRIFNTAGDAILAEFPSAVAAVRCATELQAALRTHNEHLPDDERMWFRIGINLGDVIVQGEDLLGDGVNVAARIQTIAEPGGICISGSVYDQIQNKLSLQFNLLGERNFKNITQPVRTFLIADANGSTLEALTPKPANIRKMPVAVAVLVIVGVISAVSGGYMMYRAYNSQDSGQLNKPAYLQNQAVDSQRRSSEEERLAAEQHERETKLEAEKQAALKALEQAQVEKIRLDQELKRTATDKRIAELEAEKQAAKKALEQAQTEKKRLNQELKRTTTEKRVSESNSQKMNASKSKKEAPSIISDPAAMQVSDESQRSTADVTNVTKSEQKVPASAALTTQTDKSNTPETGELQQADQKKPVGKIKITSTPHGAEIYLNGKFMGITPAELKDVPVGTYTIVLKKEDYDDWKDTVTVKDGKTVFLSD